MTNKHALEELTDRIQQNCGIRGVRTVADVSRQRLPDTASEELKHDKTETLVPGRHSP